MNTADVSDAIRFVSNHIIMPRFQSLERFEVMEKKPGNLVTVADREAEHELAAILTRSTPEAIVVGEEEVFFQPDLVAALPDAALAWVIDPIDGTRNFAHGSPNFAVMVAEVRHGVTQRGWIWQPVYERMYVGELGRGVTCNAVPLHRDSEPHQDLVGGGFGGRLSVSGPGFTIREPIHCCGVEYPKLLKGQRDFLLYRSMHPWDHLAGVLMLRELGGDAMGLDGARYQPGMTGQHHLLAAATPAILDKARRHIREH